MRFGENGVSSLLLFLLLLKSEENVIELVKGQVAVSLRVHVMILKTEMVWEFIVSV